MTGRGLDRFDNLKRLMALDIEPMIQKAIKDIAKAALDAFSKALSQEPPPEQPGVVHLEQARIFRQCQRWSKHALNNVVS